jgi:nicotinate phosphoribosyltransferase
MDYSQEIFNKVDKRDDRIITSMLNDDLYKFSMGQCVFHQYPDINVKYEFRCRNTGISLSFLQEHLKFQVESMQTLALTDAEKGYLMTLGFFKDDYLDYLSQYRYKPEQVDIYQTVDSTTGQQTLGIDIEGPWVETILWEVKLLALVNELYFIHTGGWDGSAHNKLDWKIKAFKEMPRFTFAEFGTRRRFSSEWQEEVARKLAMECPNMVGTSNVKLAMDLGVKPIGTMAHEYISAHLGLVDSAREAQKRALHVWLQEYDNNLGIALTDTFTTKAFFEDFGHVLTNAFNGLRHDSGDPIKFGYDAIKHYQSMGVDPKTKTLVFSDGLDAPTAINIYKEFTGLIGVSFGIGTNLTNDVGATPLNIVIKLVQCNGKPVVKLSDNPAKAIGDKNKIKEVREAYGV